VIPFYKARLVRGVSYREAVAQLTFCPRKPAKILLELLNSARSFSSCCCDLFLSSDFLDSSNAENQLKLNPERLLVCTFSLMLMLHQLAS
jgi:hypothetical protein